jgi:copper chaperone CopZ
MKYLIVFSLLISFSALADTGVYTIEGMDCGACAKSISKKVCALENIETCSVEVGKMTLTSKVGTQLDQEKIKEAVTAANPKFKVSKSEIK